MGAPVDVGVAQQRQYRVIERRRRQLHLTAGGGVAIFGNDPPHDLDLHFAQLQLVVFGERALFLNQPAHARIAVEVERVDPCELVPDLQIEKVLVRISPAGVALPQELEIPWIGLDHPSARRMEKLGEDDLALVLCQLAGGLQAQLEMPVACAFFGEGLELNEHRRHQIERQADPGELAHQRGHAVVVLQRVQAYPWQDVLACREIFVIRLVHVPEDCDVGHCGIFDVIQNAADS